MALQTAIEPAVLHEDISTRKAEKAIASSGSAVLRLPAEVLEQILYLVDPETFASLVLTSRLWRYAAASPQLYAFHLSRCPFYSATHNVIKGPFDDDSLPKLKRQFVQEAKRNLYSVFTRPRTTIVNLISTTASSAGAFPFGEAFEFSFSAQGLWCLAKSSSRIVVIDIASEVPVIKRELKVVRKPLAAYILQDGTKLAVLSSSHNVNIYDLESVPSLVRSVSLDEEAHALALSPHGEVLAVAYDGGVEVSSLLPNALPTDRRAVKSDRVDSLSFSADGTMLLGTTFTSKNAGTVVISAPYFIETGEDMPHNELISHMWTAQILFPYSSRDCSHAALLPRQMDHDANWTLTYDRVFESFRAVRTDDLRNGHTYFAGPQPKISAERQRSKSLLTPCTLPAITSNGELVAAGFLGNEIWLYGVPEDLDSHTLSANNSPIAEPSSATDQAPNLTEIEGLPRWQVLVDKYRNVFAKGRRITTVSNVNIMTWVSGPKSEKGLQNVRERLVIGAPGGVSMGDDFEQEEMASVDGGRLVILDFNWTPDAGQTREITIEIGLAEPEKLEEQDTDMATEIALVRRRTVARRDGIPRSHVASVADVLRPADEPAPPVPALPTSVGFGLDRVSQPSPPSEEPSTPVSPTHGITLQEAAAAFDGPYSHTAPRSRNTLYRSATAVEANRRRAPPVLPSSGTVEYRRTDGTELPHESDADNWVPPPPPYTPDAEGPLPDHLRRTLLPRQPTGLANALGSIRRPMRALATLEQMNFRRRSSADIDLVSHSSGSRHSLAAIPLDRDVNDVVSPATDGRSDSPTSSRAISPLAPLRRPMSTYESRSNRSSMYRAALRPPPEPISVLPESEAADEDSQRETTTPLPNIISTRPRTFRSSSLTLSGGNLQTRLDYPLPPPPPKGAVSPVNTPSPVRSPLRHQHSQSDIPRSTAFSLDTPEVPVMSIPGQPLETVPEPAVPQVSVAQQRRPLTVAAPEPSAYAASSAQFPAPTISELPANDRLSRFRSTLRRAAERTVSQPHLRTVSAMNFSSNTVGRRSSNTRLNTIYSEGLETVLPRPQGPSRAQIRADMRATEAMFSNSTVTTQIYSTANPPVSQTTSRASSRLARRFSQLRGQSEGPARPELSSHRGADTEQEIVDGYVGRGRRRSRAGMQPESWEQIFPEEPRLHNGREQEDRKKRKGGGRCVVM